VKHGDGIPWENKGLIKIGIVHRSEATINKGIIKKYVGVGRDDDKLVVRIFVIDGSNDTGGCDRFANSTIDLKNDLQLVVFKSPTKRCSTLAEHPL
jgi:hypothetical protein